MDLALNNLQRLICHKTNQTFSHPVLSISSAISLLLSSTCFSHLLVSLSLSLTCPVSNSNKFRLYFCCFIIVTITRVIGPAYLSQYFSLLFNHLVTISNTLLEFLHLKKKFFRLEHFRSALFHLVLKSDYLVKCIEIKGYFMKMSEMIFFF